MLTQKAFYALISSKTIHPQSHLLPTAGLRYRGSDIFAKDGCSGRVNVTGRPLVLTRAGVGEVVAEIDRVIAALTALRDEVADGVTYEEIQRVIGRC